MAAALRLSKRSVSNISVKNIYVQSPCLQEEPPVDPKTLASLLKLCKTSLDGTLLHALAMQTGLHTDLFLANSLIDMYGRCGALEDSLHTFSTISLRNVVSWNLAIRACTMNANPRKALFFFDTMQPEHVKPDRVTFLSVLLACADLKDVLEARRMEASLVKYDANVDVVISSSMINMYYKCGSLEDAERIFNSMAMQDVVSWNTMIAAYTQLGRPKKALLLFQQMAAKGTTPTQATYSTLLNLCANEGSLEEGRSLHASLKSSGLAMDFVLANALVSMYGKCNSMEGALDVFDSIHDRTAVSWSAVISACVHSSQAPLAIQLHQQMQMEGLTPDLFIISNSLSACALSSNVVAGKRFHACIGGAALTSDTVVGTALVNMYGQWQCPDQALNTFDGLLRRDVVAHNAMIAAYAQCGLKKKVVQHFLQTQQEGILPGKATFTSTFDSCGDKEGKFMHAYYLNTGLDVDNEVGTTLITMYGKHGKMKHAKAMFEGLLERDVVAWNAIISAYVRKEHFRGALQAFQQLQLEGLLPNAATYASSLSACITRAALIDGKYMHAFIIGASMESDSIVGTALINMYAKCGSLGHAKIIFDMLSHKTGVTWNALVAAYAQHGYSKEALYFFHVMQSKGVCIDQATFSSVLCACSRAGYIDEGVQCFVSILQKHGITPTVQHHNCLVDLVSRAGRLEEGENLMTLMPAGPSNTSWTAWLSACWMHSDLERGKQVAHFLSKLECIHDS